MKLAKVVLHWRGRCGGQALACELVSGSLRLAAVLLPRGNLA